MRDLHILRCVLICLCDFFRRHSRCPVCHASPSSSQWTFFFFFFARQEMPRVKLTLSRCCRAGDM
jgi:hypothetical protein